MKGNLLRVDEKYIPYISWFVVIAVVVLSGMRFPVSSPIIGDEDYYRDEVVYLSKYGVLAALSQGTSVVYSLLVFLFSKIIFSSFLVSARVLSVVFFLINCKLFLKCFEQFRGLGYMEKYFGILFFSAISLTWLWKGLPDMVCVSALLSCFYLISRHRSYRSFFLVGILLFIGFAVKPVVIFAIPGMLLFILLHNLKAEKFLRNATKIVLFLFSFGACFYLYHIPGYRANHRLMLEDKNHTYAGEKRVENHNLWSERNVYYAAYNLHNWPTEWSVTWGEVDSFKQQHPDINLKLGYTEFVKSYFSAWASGIANKFFLSLPLEIQHGFFFSKWTVINKAVKSFFVIGIITLILIGTMFVFQWQFIKQNLLLYAMPFSFFAGIAIYLFIPLQNNWLLFCMPFFSLPVVKFLFRYVNVVVLFGLQVIYIVVAR